MMPDERKKDWRTWRFDQMAFMSNERVDNPREATVEHYVGLEHLDSESLEIRRWGSPSDVEATKLRFRKGDIIFGRRRVYQRKLAVAPFEGICSAHAMVLRARPEVALPEFLPFFMQSDLFMERAKQISVGSLSPTINWKTLAKEEFSLPPLEEQRRIAEVLEATDECVVSCRLVAENLLAMRRSMQDALLFPSPKDGSQGTVPLTNVCNINPSDPPLPEGALFVPMECVTEWQRDITRFEVRGSRGGVRAAGGDVLMARITPCLENGKIAQVPEHVGRCGGSTEFIVIRAKQKVDRSYLFWLASSDRLRNAAIGMMSGTTGRQRVTGTDLAGIRVLAVSQTDQTRAGQILDAVETRRQEALSRLKSARSLRRAALNELLGVV